MKTSRIAGLFAFILFTFYLPLNFASHETCCHAHAAGLQTEQSHSAEHAEDVVYFNTSTHKFHRMDCIWAQRCTVNCIAISRAEAVRRGGVACKVCGG
jgi:hypothetical protein